VTLPERRNGFRRSRRIRKESPNKLVETDAPLASPPATSTPEPVRFLVVEDEPLIGLDLVTLLEDAGYVVVGPITTLAQALAEAEAFRPHAAFVDVNLEDGPTGPEVARRLADRHGARCLFLTGNPELAEAGAADGLIRKPYRVEAVAEAAAWLAALALGDLRDRPAGVDAVG
jgi:CheY-like chemotaxis protein